MKDKSFKRRPLTNPNVSKVIKKLCRYVKAFEGFWGLFSKSPLNGVWGKAPAMLCHEPEFER